MDRSKGLSRRLVLLGSAGLFVLAGSPCRLGGCRRRPDTRIDSDTGWAPSGAGPMPPSASSVTAWTRPPTAIAAPASANGTTSNTRENNAPPPPTASARTLITNAQYAAFRRGHRAPGARCGRGDLESYRLIHPYERTRRHAWSGGQPPAGRADHPVVLVSHGDARAYADWLSAETGLTWRLPTWREWEKAARGSDGRIFPWGDDWDPARLNSHDQGPFDTLPVGSFPDGRQPLRPAGRGGPGLRMDGERDQTRALRGARRLLGRFRLRRLPPRRPPQPPARPQAHPGRLPASEIVLVVEGN